MTDDNTQEIQALKPVVETEQSAPAEAVVEQSELEAAIAAAPVSVFYHGLEVVEKLVTINAEGRECRMSDGTTMFVPLSELGE